MKKLKQKIKKNLILIASIILVILLILAFFVFQKKTISINSEQFYEQINSGIKNAYVLENELYFDSNGTQYKIFASDDILSSALEISPLEFRQNVDYEFLFVIIFAILLLLYIAKISKRQAKSSDTRQGFIPPNFRIGNGSKIKFDEIIGQENAKKELQKICELVKNNEYLHKGVLLTGPSGVGKTMLAKAVANSLNISFLYQSASSFNEMFVGVGAKRVRELFFTARELGRCIVFIDEIDAIGKKRNFHSMSDTDSTLNELLSELDGFFELKNVVIIAATNRADALDSALLRRFDKKINFSLPNSDERRQFIQKMQQNSLLDGDANLLALLCKGFSGASFATLANEIKMSKKTMSQDEAVEQILAIKYGTTASENEANERLVFYHAAKAVISQYFDAKALIVGANFCELSQEFSELTSKELLARIKNILSACIATRINFGDFGEELKDEFRELESLLKRLENLNKMAKLSGKEVEFELESINKECEQIANYELENIKILATKISEEKVVFLAK